MFIVSGGVGRCGTRFMWRLFHALGFLVGHERVHRDGISSWGVSIPVHFETVQERICPAHVHEWADVVLLPVRHPVPNIASLSDMKLTRGRQAMQEDFIQRVLDGYASLPTLNAVTTTNKDVVRYQAMCWLYWNKLSVEHADYVFQIERIYEREVTDQIAKLLAVDNSELHRIVNNLPPDHTRKELNMPQVSGINSWQDLSHIDEELTVEVQHLAQELGYDE